MGILANAKHERACQMLHKRICDGEDPVAARLAVYQEVIYSGDDPHGQSVVDNARKWVNQPDIKKRLAEMQTRTALLADIDSGLLVLQARKIAEFDTAKFLSGKGNISHLPGDVEIVEEEGAEGETTTRRIFKTKIKASDRLGAWTLIARVLGLEAPKKIAPTNPEGDGPPDLMAPLFNDADRIRALTALFNRAKEKAA